MRPEPTREQLRDMWLSQKEQNKMILARAALLTHDNRMLRDRIAELERSLKTKQTSPGTK